LVTFVFAQGKLVEEEKMENRKRGEVASRKGLPAANGEMYTEGTEEGLETTEKRKPHPENRRVRHPSL
jgi:hypothetical protein